MTMNPPRPAPSAEAIRRRRTSVVVSTRGTFPPWNAPWIVRALRNSVRTCVGLLFLVFGGGLVAEPPHSSIVLVASVPFAVLILQAGIRCLPFRIPWVSDHPLPASLISSIPLAVVSVNVALVYRESADVVAQSIAAVVLIAALLSLRMDNVARLASRIEDLVLRFPSRALEPCALGEPVFGTAEKLLRGSWQLYLGTVIVFELVFWLFFGAAHLSRTKSGWITELVVQGQPGVLAAASLLPLTRLQLQKLNRMLAGLRVRSTAVDAMGREFRIAIVTEFRRFYRHWFGTAWSLLLAFSVFFVAGNWIRAFGSPQDLHPRTGEPVQFSVGDGFFAVATYVLIVIAGAYVYLVGAYVMRTVLALRWLRRAKLLELAVREDHPDETGGLIPIADYALSMLIPVMVFSLWTTWAVIGYGDARHTGVLHESWSQSPYFALEALLFALGVCAPLWVGSNLLVSALALRGALLEHDAAIPGRAYRLRLLKDLPRTLMGPATVGVFLSVATVTASTTIQLVSGAYAVPITLLRVGLLISVLLTAASIVTILQQLQSTRPRKGRYRVPSRLAVNRG